VTIGSRHPFGKHFALAGGAVFVDLVLDLPISRANVGGNRLPSWRVGIKGGHDLRCYLLYRMPEERQERGETGNGSRRSLHHRDRNSAIGASFRLEPSGRAGPAQS